MTTIIRAFVVASVVSTTIVVDALLVTPSTPLPPPAAVVVMASTRTQKEYQTDNRMLSLNVHNWVSKTMRCTGNVIQDVLSVPPASAAEQPQAPPLTKQEISMLREAFAAFYGTNRDPPRALELLSEVIDAWQRQPPDERAGLYRVRADCYMAVSKPLEAIQDYSTAINLLQQRKSFVD
jgi:hypothetical protein